MIKNILKVLPLLLIAFVLFTSDAKADSPINLNGYAWSDNIGWLSFNSSNPGAGSGASYAVTLATSSNIGTFGGYAWSDNIGWVSFQNGDGSHPVATVNLSTGIVNGWARACAGTVNGDCVSADRTDGWDGWIELSGTNHPTQSGLTGIANSNQGVSYNSESKSFSGYAWGSDVVGWLAFYTSVPGGKVTVVDPTTSTTLVGVCVTTPTGSGVTWSIQNVSGGTDPYSYKWNNGASTTDPTGVTSLTTPGSSGDTPTVPTVMIGSLDGQVITPTCESGTVLASGVDGPGVDGTVGGGTGSGAMWVDNNPTLTTTKVLVGRSAKVNWELPTGYSCVGSENENENPNIGWNNVPINSSYKDPASTTAKLNNLGIYNIDIKCTETADPTNVINLGPVKIIVSDSTIREN